RRYGTDGARSAPIANAPRHPYTGRTVIATSPARIVPQAHDDSSSTIIRPRWERGESSETSVAATGSSPPSPSPAITRAPSKVSYVGASADSAAPAEKTTNVVVNTLRRP